MEESANRQSRSSIRHSTRSTPKVTDHPWLTISTPSYSEFSPSPSSSMDTVISPTPTPNNASSSKYDWRMHSLMLSKHILTRGLIDGIGSDIQVLIPAWNKTYKLHRLVLDQNPYFKLLLQGSFKEADENTITLHFENENPFITTSSFQFVLEYLYGKIEEPQITQSNVREILATCSYFQLDVCGICVDFILRNLTHQNVIDYLLFTNEFMVQGSDRICDAIFTFLCREAYHMDRSTLTSLPLDWLKKVIESDAFWVPSEYDRYQFVKQVIQARYSVFTNAKSTNFVLSELDTNPQCHIITRSIYYMHMTFEQLESIEKDIHPLTKQRLVPESILKEALWTQIKLRSKIESSLERSSTLDCTIPASSIKHKSEEKKERLKNTNYDECDFSEEEEEDDEQSVKYYPIPTNDTTTYTGECAISLAFSSSKKKPVIEQYSTYPPFRFSVEFSDVTSLKYGMRVYSDTVFYAGSNWNMYIQKTRSQRKGALQLGVYLHRQSVSQNPNQCPHTSSSAEDASDAYENVRSPNNENWSFSRYSDRRKVVRTWFKIYCPTRGPKHALTLFQSSPDNFSVLQSWGWRSTTLCADEDTTNNAAEDVNDADTLASSSPPPLIYPPHTLVQYLQSTYDPKVLKNTTSTQKSSSTLRFTVVMGHV